MRAWRLTVGIAWKGSFAHRISDRFEPSRTIHTWRPWMQPWPDLEPLSPRRILAKGTIAASRFGGCAETGRRRPQRCSALRWSRHCGGLIDHFAGGATQKHVATRAFAIVVAGDILRSTVAIRSVPPGERLSLPQHRCGWLRCLSCRGPFMDPATFKLTGWRLVEPINFTRPKGGRRDFGHSDGGGGAGRLGTEFRSGCGATSGQG